MNAMNPGAPAEREIGPSVVVGVLGLLLGVCVIVRLSVGRGELPPNFSAVAAAALFAGFLLARNAGFRVRGRVRRWGRGLALGLPIAAMALSDAFLGGYDWRLMAVVYASLAAPALLGERLGSRPTPALIAAAAVGSSMVFFVATNLGVWLFSNWYEPTPAGLARCFIAALPFLKYTLLGDVLWSGVFFGAWAVVRRGLGSARLAGATAA